MKASTRTKAPATGEAAVETPTATKISFNFEDTIKARAELMVFERKKDEQGFSITRVINAAVDEYLEKNKY